MSFGAPLFLWALGLLLPVLVLFLFRRRRRLVRVPSTAVWRLGTGTVVKNRRIRHVRRLLALLACVLGVAALAFAAARPAGRRVDTIVFVVDVSASMSGPAIEEAKRFVAREIATLGTHGRVAIVAAGAEPRVVVPLAPPSPTIEGAIRSLVPRAERSAIDEAIALAESLGGYSARVVVVSDGPVDAAISRRDSKPTLRVVGGSKKDNVGISTFYSRAALEARDEDAREAVIAIATSSSRERRARLKVRHDAVVLAERDVIVPPSGEVSERVGLRGGGRVTATVESADGIADAIALDDSAFLDEPVRSAPRVAMIGPADSMAGFFLEKALRAANVTAIARVPENEQPPKDVDIAIVLVDGSARPKDVPTIYVGVEPADLGLSVRTIGQDQSKLRSIASDDPFMRGVSLDELTTVGAKTATAPRGARVLVDLDGGPVLIAGGVADHAWVWLGIDPEQSDLVLRVAFPVLVGNMLAQLGGDARAITADTVPRSEVKMEIARADAPLPAAPDPRWRVPASPAVLLAALGAILLALEAWLTFRKGWAT